MFAKLLFIKTEEDDLCLWHLVQKDVALTAFNYIRGQMLRLQAHGHTFGKDVCTLCALPSKLYCQWSEPKSMKRALYYFLLSALLRQVVCKSVSRPASELLGKESFYKEAFSVQNRTLL